MSDQASAPQWKSQTSFIFATSAAAIGLGNIWRFPYMVGQNGGAMFVLIYLGCVVLLGLPLLIAEVVLGRMGRKNPVAALVNVARSSQRSKKWGWLGGLNILTSFLILTYYIVIVGWVLDYLGRAAIGQFAHATEASVLQTFSHLQASHWQMLISDSLVAFGSMAIIYLGVKRGLERAVLVMFPALVVLMLLLLGYSMTTSGFTEALSFLFKPEMSELSSRTILLALGQAFFSLNVAMGVTMMFSAYLPKKTPIISSVIAVAIADTGIALLAGLVIFPVVFANQLHVEAGPSLIFQTLPLAFSRIPFGNVVAGLFFLMLFFAAFSSVIALLEPSVSWLMEAWNLTRHRAVLIAGTIMWLLSLLTIGSFSHGKHLQLFGVTYFKGIDYLTANVMLPVGGLLIAVFTGWLLCKKSMHDELAWNVQSTWYKAWMLSLRYVAPIGIIGIVLVALHIL